MPFKPRPVPPIYHPQIVTDTIIYAAENPSTAIIAGGTGLGVMYAERISPRLADWITEKVGFVGQTTDEKSSGDYAGSLFEPIDSFDTIEGRFSDEQLKSDPITWLATHQTIKNVLLATAVLAGGLLAWKVFGKSEKS